jgi:hypothetical protein
MVTLERRPGVNPKKGFFNGPGTAALETGFAALKGRKLRRARREGKDVPPDTCAEDGEGGGTAAWGGGPPPEGVLFGGTRPKWGTESELGRVLLMAGFRVGLGEKRGMYEGALAVLVCVCACESAVFEALGDGCGPIAVTSMALESL